MKRIVFLSIVLTIVFVCNTFSAQESFDVSLKVRKEMTITEVQALSFGTVLIGSIDQMVTIAPGDTGSAEFNITGDDQASVSLSIVESSITMIGSTFSDQHVTVNNFNLSTSVTLLPEYEIRVGATAHVNADQYAQDYTGSATLNVVYN
ncbi:MAG: DUF4402 domain-containing protein [Desulfobacterales bacterium]|nr:DUF4402 domain-containing protein [Desulfobacterales bacterium]